MSNLSDMYKYLNDENINLADIKASTFYKYLNLYKQAGFNIVKIKSVYKMIRYSDVIKLSDAERGFIAYLKLLSYMLFPKTKDKILTKFFNKMLQLTNEETKKEIENKFETMQKATENNLYKEKLELFEKYKNEDRNINVQLKNGNSLNLIPKDISFKNRKIYFNFLDNENKEIKQIEINKIINMTKRQPQIILKSDTKEIIFELYGRLAKIYVLKEGERIIEGSSDKIVIANGSSDKTALFRRLLKYDTLCKVRYPKKDAGEFKKLIEKSLENINKLDNNNFIEV